MTKRELIKILTKNKWCFSADGSSLLPSALRPHLLMHSKIVVISTTLGAFLVSFFASLFIGETNVSAASLTLSIPESISLSISTQNSVAYKASGKSNITIKTDAYAGYTLNIKSKDGTNTLKSSEGKTINSISSALDNYQSNGATNTWAFLPDKLNSSSNTKYQPGPKSDVLLGQSSSSNSTPATYPISIAAKIDNNQPTGTYKNTFTITATANPVPYTFSYNSNGGSSTPSTQTGTGNEGSTKNLTTSTPSKSGYTFQGWCTVNPGTSESCPSSGTKYSSGAAYTLTNSSNSVTFYAIWKAESSGGGTNRGSLGYMQSFTSSSCSSKLPNIHDYGMATDRRDSNTYTIAKLKDGKCWMVTNLKIVGRTINSTYSDMTSGSFTIPASEMSGFKDSSTNSNAAYINSTYGGYYTWYTATAGSTISSGTAPNSICPKGWKLPTDGTNGDYSKIKESYNNVSSIQSAPVPNFIFSGASNDSTFPNGPFTRGSFWSSTTTKANDSMCLNVNQSDIEAGHAHWRDHGLAIRCVLR